MEPLPCAIIYKANMEVNMEHKNRIKRINELAKKAKTEGLTPEEKKEQKKLREEYLEVFKANFKAQLENIEIVDSEMEEEAECAAEEVIKEIDKNKQN